MEKQNELDFKKNQYLSRFINFYIIFSPIYYILSLEIGSKSHYIFAGAIILFMICGLKYFNHFKKKAIWIIVLFFSIFLIYSFIGYIGCLYNWVGMIFMLAGCAFPWFIVGLYVTDYHTILQGFKKVLLFAWISNILLILYCYKTGRPMSGNMEISYSILPVLIISLYFALKEKNVKYLIYATFSLIIIIAVGSRGPLLCIMAFVILYLMLNFKKSKILIIALLALTIVVFYNYNSILDGLIDLFEEYNISSRTLYKIKNGSISDDTGRSSIKEVAFEQLEEHPWLGTGIAVERIKINELVMNKDMGSCYPHNLLIEILVQYGYVIGTAIILYLIYLVIKSVQKGNIDEKELLIIIFSIEIIRLMLSSSYLRSSLFFLWLGLSINVVYKNREEKIEENSNNSTNQLTNSGN